jgi:hypothetical protein
MYRCVGKTCRCRLHPGVQRQELRQQRQQPAIGQHRHRAHQQAQAVGALRHGFERVVLQPQQVARDLAVVAPSGLGERGAARGALHQPHADLRLEQPQLLAHGAVREAQLLGGLAHAVMAGHGIEDQQRAGAWNVTVHGGFVRKTDNAKD